MKSKGSVIVPLVLGAGHAARTTASSAGAMIATNIYIPKRTITFTSDTRRWDAEKFIRESQTHLQQLDRIYSIMLRAATRDRGECEIDISDTFDDAADHYIYVRDPKFYRGKASEIAPECHAGEVCSLILTMACALSVVRYTSAQNVDVLFIPERVNARMLEFVDIIISALNGRECAQGATIRMVTANAFFTKARAPRGPSRYTDGAFNDDI